MKFQCIVIDAPWSFSDKLTMSDVPRGAEANYHTMSNQDIINLDVKSVADPDGCVIALWVPSSLLKEGLASMENYGFELKQTYIWVKVKKEPLKARFRNVLKAIKKSESIDIKLINDALKNFSLKDTLAFFMGRLFRQTHEICLIGINNKKIYKKLANKSQRSVCFGFNDKHSSKPEDLQDSLDIMFSGTEKLEMFARRLRPGWTCIGDEVCNGEDIRDSLAKLI